MPCAIISHNPSLSGNSRRSIFQTEISFKLAHHHTTAVPLIYCPGKRDQRRQKAALERALALANRQCYRAIALAETDKALLSNNKIPLLDGAMWQISQLPRLLHQVEPHWQQLHLAMEVHNQRDAAMARLLARECRFLHLFGNNQELRQRTSERIYTDYGLICQHSTERPPVDLVIAAPQRAKTDSWPSWPQRVSLPSGQTLPLHWAESLLLSVDGGQLLQEWHRINIIDKLQYLARRSTYYGLLPSCNNHSANKDSISATLVS